MRKLAMLEAEFISTATLYGKIIIAERFLPHKKKRILPIDIGGKAGGIKYSMEGILFKFAWDSEGIYDGDLKAMKAACHGKRAQLCTANTMYLIICLSPRIK